MGYDDRKMDSRLDVQQQKLQHDLTLAREVQKTISSKGWKNVIGPKIHFMLLNVTGGFDGKKWHKGKIDNARKENTWRYYVGYKQYGIELVDYVMNFATSIKKMEESFKDIDALRKQPLRAPMTGKEDSYAGEL